MIIKTKLLIIAKDDFPLETIKGQPVSNFIRKLFLSKWKECHVCYEKRKGIQVHWEGRP